MSERKCFVLLSYQDKLIVLLVLEQQTLMVDWNIETYA